MKIAYIIIFTLGFSCVLATAFAQGDVVDVPQVSNKTSASAQTPDESSMQIDGDGRKQDHQAEVLNNPVISDFGRANAMLNLTGSNGSNTAIGSSTTETPRGKDNTIGQRRNAATDDVLLDNQDKASVEKQKDNYGHKKKKKSKLTDEEKEYESAPASGLGATPTTP